MKLAEEFSMNNKGRVPAGGDSGQDLDQDRLTSS